MSDSHLVRSKGKLGVMAFLDLHVQEAKETFGLS